MSHTYISQDHHARYLGTHHFASLDGLRFLCISLVIWHHVPIWKSLDPIFFSRGHTGVDFFFVLSGYLITTLLLREDDAAGTINLKGFYWRRILRIVPIYFFVVTIAVCYEVFVKGHSGNLDILPYYYLFLSNFIESRDVVFLDPTWSLSIEEQFYLIWPVLLLLLSRHLRVPVLIGLIVWNAAVAFDLFDLIGVTAIEVGPLSFGLRGPTYAPILMGALCAVLLHRPTSFRTIAMLTGFKAAAWVWLLALGTAYAMLPDILRGWPNLIVHSLMCLTLISLVIREDNSLASFLQLRPILRIGQISYGIYLYHLFALAIVSKVFQVFGWTNWWWILGLYYILAIMISEFSFRTLEAYFTRFRKSGWGR